MKNPVNEQGLDEDEQRLGDLWSMSDKERDALFKKVFWPFLLIIFALVGFVIYCEVSKNAEKHTQKHPAAPFTRSPPESYDSSSLKR